MSVIGHWRRSALGAGGVALLLPLGLTVGVVLTAALGGESTLSALGQVYAGPKAPDRVAAPGLESARKVPSVPVRRATTTRTPRAGGSAAADPATGPAGPENPDPGPGTGPGPGPADPDPPPADPAPPANERPPSDGPPPTAPEPDSPLRETGQAVADTVADVPVVGEQTGGAVQTVVDLIP